MEETSCKLCHHLVEELNHTLILCPTISNWWKIYLPIMESLDHANKSFLAVTEFILMNGNEDERAIFFTIAEGL